MPIIDSIKIGRRKWQVQMGDYIVFNDEYYKFHTGDGRAIYWKSYLKVTSIKLTDASLKKIPIDQLQKRERSSLFAKGGRVIEYIF